MNSSVSCFYVKFGGNLGIQSVEPGGPYSKSFRDISTARGSSTFGHASGAPPIIKSRRSGCEGALGIAARARTRNK